MLKELTKSDWLAMLDIHEEMIPHALILRGTRNLKSKYQEHKKFFTDVFELSSPNGVLEDVFIGSYKGEIIGYASVYGDCMASEITHLFGVLGTSIVVQTGCCGALVQDMVPGDLVCPTSAYCGEGASQYYMSEKEVSASLWLVEKLKCIRPHKGPIWTTSALFAEGESDIQAWSNQGYIAVDMETATTFSVAKHFNMNRVALLFVFDNPLLGDHLLMTDAEKESRRIQGEQAMLDSVFSLIQE